MGWKLCPNCKGSNDSNAEHCRYCFTPFEKREKKEKELDLKITKLTELYSKGEITSGQFDKAVRILESGEKNKLLDDFLSEKISLTTFRRVFK